MTNLASKKSLSSLAFNSFGRYFHMGDLLKFRFIQWLLCRDILHSIVWSDNYWLTLERNTKTILEVNGIPDFVLHYHFYFTVMGCFVPFLSTLGQADLAWGTWSWRSSRGFSSSRLSSIILLFWIRWLLKSSSKERVPLCSAWLIFRMPKPQKEFFNK